MSTSHQAKNLKRSHEDDSGSDGDDLVGPSLTEAAPPMKRKVLPYEKLYLDALPFAESYEKSYMHRDIITHCLVTATDFVITASCDGHIKFWKKMEVGIEFVKHFRSHLGKTDSIYIVKSMSHWAMCFASFLGYIGYFHLNYSIPFRSYLQYFL